MGIGPLSKESSILRDFYHPPRDTPPPLSARLAISSPKEEQGNRQYLTKQRSLQQSHFLQHTRVIINLISLLFHLIFMLSFWINANPW
jgi:hypothetical protein